MKLLVCGSRRWGTMPTGIPASLVLAAFDNAHAERARVRVEIIALAPTELIHGAAAGADTVAAAIAITDNLAKIVRPFPADWAGDGKSAGPRRNARMLAEGRPDRGLAFGALWWNDPGEWMRRGARIRKTGTGDMVHRMLAARLPVRWIATAGAEAVDLTEMPPPTGDA